MSLNLQFDMFFLDPHEMYYILQYAQDFQPM
jgi:hypothetical protein